MALCVSGCLESSSACNHLILQDWRGRICLDQDILRRSLKFSYIAVHSCNLHSSP